jgi:hypothetical protein
MSNQSTDPTFVYNMKKVFMVLGVVFAILVLLAGILIGYAAYTGSKLDASSKAYVDANVPPIISTWSTSELLGRASPELREAASNEQLSQLFGKLRQLGPLIKYEGAKGGTNTVVTAGSGKLITADYEASATFVNGPATIKIRLVQENGQWALLRFYVDSPIFLK